MVALAGMLGLTRAALGLYESGDRTPSPDVLDRMAACLGMPREFFFCEPPRENRAPIFYRSLSAATKTERQKAERRFGWLREIVDILEESVVFPAVSISDFNPATALGWEEIEDAAEQLRRKWGVPDGPVPELIHVAESHGIVVSRFQMESHDLDAFSQWPEGGSRPFILLNSEKDSAARLRFDTAHELGHQILHRRIEPALFRRPEIFKLVEQQAFRFAGAFLMPAGSFLDDVDAVSLDYLRVLKPGWGVSIGAMVMRLRDLEVIDETESQRLWRTYAMRGYRRGEPLDDELKPEVPSLLATAVKTVGGPREFASAMRGRIALPVGLCEELLGLPDGSLSGASEPPAFRLRLVGEGDAFGDESPE